MWVAISSVSSNIPRGGRAATPVGAATAAVRAGRKALELVASDTEVTYLANSERQLAIERLLIRFGEALKSVPNQTLTQIDADIGPVLKDFAISPRIGMRRDWITA